MPPWLEYVLRTLLGVAGLTVVFGTLLSALTTVVLPRGTPSALNRLVFVGWRLVFDRLAGREADHGRRDRVLAFLTPVSMISLLFAWLSLQSVGFTMIYVALGKTDVGEAFLLSGSTLLTLGFSPVDGSVVQTVVAFLDATIGFALISLLIAYLPQMYSAFQARERKVALLAVRAGTPPSPITMLSRFEAIGYGTSLDDLWTEWEEWFAALDESHTSLSPLAFYRSPDPSRSWVNAAGVVLDAAALRVAAVADGRTPQAQLCIRAGFVALRNIAALFRIPFDPDPEPTDPISVRRDEFDAACRELAEAGVELVDDLDQAWRDYAGWRVNYDTVLLALAALTVAPPDVMWVSDRAPRNVSPSLLDPSAALTRMGRPTDEYAKVEVGDEARHALDDRP